MIHIVAPIFVTVEYARFRTPAKVAVICIIRNTAKVIPINRAENLALSLTSNLNPIRRMPLYLMTPRRRARPGVPMEARAGRMPGPVRRRYRAPSRREGIGRPGFELEDYALRSL
jgi:hypothetical protein